LVASQIGSSVPLTYFSILFFFWAVLGFELRASRLLDRCPITYAALPTLLIIKKAIQDAPGSCFISLSLSEIAISPGVLHHIKK
jgi:hypothetical protein